MGATLTGSGVPIGADRKGGSDIFSTGCKVVGDNSTGPKLAGEGVFLLDFVGVLVGGFTVVGADFPSLS